MTVDSNTYIDCLQWTIIWTFQNMGLVLRGPTQTPPPCLVKNQSSVLFFLNTSLNDKYNFLETELLNILNVMAPLKKIQPRKNVSNWITEETRRSMRIRDIAREIASNTQRPDDWLSYKILRNRCNTLVRTDRTKHFKNLN